MNNLANIFIEMDKLDSLMYIVNKENGANYISNKKLLSQLNKVIRLQTNDTNTMVVDSSSGKYLDVEYLKQQKKILVKQMKLMGQRV